METLLKDYPANVITPKTYEEVWRTFWRVTREVAQGDADEFLVGKEAGDLRVIYICGSCFRLRWCPPGTFMMGSSERERGRFEDEVLHKVTLSQGFWILETEVTRSMWKAIIRSDFRTLSEDEAALPVDLDYWRECQKFVAKLNGLGYPPVGYRFSLPTEAQWEYACRAGTRTAFSWGSSLRGDKANCDGRYPYGTNARGWFLGKTAPVGSYAANPWGLFDMHGNLAEWCEDGYYAYPSGVVTDPLGPSRGLSHVIRGGSWRDPAHNCRSARRFGLVDNMIRDFVGFRFVLAPHAGEKLETPEEE